MSNKELAERLERARWENASNARGRVAVIDPELLRAAASALRGMEDAEDDRTEAIQKAVQWIDAYPVDVFRPIGSDRMAQANEALQAIGVDIGAMHAQWARHLLDGLGRILRPALPSPPPTEGKK